VKQIIYLLLSVFLFSCGNNKQEAITTTQETPKLSIATKHISIENVKTIYQKEVENWKELKAVNTFLGKFQNVSPNEALSNALELRDLVKQLKDSIKPKIFENPSFDARINVLLNETLRLSDLTFIPAITSKDVNLQINRTIEAFSALNSKINTILSKKYFEDNIDVKVDFIGIDATKMDSISKKTIRKKKKKTLPKKNINLPKKILLPKAGEFKKQKKI